MQLFAKIIAVVLFVFTPNSLGQTIWWQTIPSVVKTGDETFVLMVFAGNNSTSVTLETWPGIVYGDNSSLIVDLKDDGISPDTQAGDKIYTAGPFRCVYSWFNPNYCWDVNSPQGLSSRDLGTVCITTNDGTKQFLIDPMIGILKPEIIPVNKVQVDPDIVITKNLINIKSPLTAQLAMRGLSTVSESSVKITSAIDAFDFLVFISANRVEIDARLTPVNFVCGQYVPVRITHSGTGHPLYNTEQYGNSKKLQAIVLLDVHNRGLMSNNLAHEILHHWSVYLDPSLGLNYIHSEYNPRSSVGSLVGGQKWVPDHDIFYTIDCENGRNGAFSSSPLDRYMMGLLPVIDVPPIFIYPETHPLPLFICSEPVSIERTVTVQDIINIHGHRTPNVHDSQKLFNLGFVVESGDRFLTDTELTYYHTLANHIVKPLPDDDLPYIGFNWAPITNFYGQNVKFRSHVQNADFNNDNTVDQVDVDMFFACMTGPAMTYPPIKIQCSLVVNDDGILDADFDLDRDVDQDDFGVMQRLLKQPAN